MSNATRLHDERTILRALEDLVDAMRGAGIKPVDPAPSTRTTGVFRFFRRSDGTVTGMSIRFAYLAPDDEELTDADTSTD